MGVRVDFEHGFFFCRCAFEDRHIPKAAGFSYNPIRQEFETKKISVAIRLREYFSETAKRQINRTLLETTPWPDAIFTPPKRKLLPFQEKAARFALNRNHSYLALEQGLGKTPTAITIMNTVALPCLIICPPFLVSNWKRELELWSLANGTGHLGKGKKVLNASAPVIIAPDSLLDKQSTIDFIKDQDFGLLIIEEAHRFKTEDAKRTKAALKTIAPLIPKVVCLSGTPMPNRPIELYPVLSSLAHNLINYMSLHEFGVKYCGGFETPHGWDYRGHSNTEELNFILKDFMFRVTKEDAMLELGDKVISTVSLGGPVPKELRRQQEKIVKPGETLDLTKRLGEIAAYRKAVGIHKIPLIAEYVENILESTTETVLLYAWHIEVIKGLEKALKRFSPTVVYGGVPIPERNHMIAEFVTFKRMRLLIAQVSTMVGYNLTKATRVVFGEFSWTPGDNDQAADRAHRIGQTKKVKVEYLALAKTLDEDILEATINKNRVIDATINKKG